MNDIAWAAGVYEGEGSCRRPRGRGQSVYVHVTQKDPEILDRLRSLFGGRVYGPIATNGRFYLHRWQLSGKRAHGFLLTMFSMLSPHRRDQVRQALGVVSVPRSSSALSARRPTMTDIHWAAGIYEAEGSCQNTGSSVALQVTQKEPHILYQLQRQFGGSVKLKQRGRNIYRWLLSGPRGRGFLLSIFTMLSARRRGQVRLAFAS